MHVICSCLHYIEHKYDINNFGEERNSVLAKISGVLIVPVYASFIIHLSSYDTNLDQRCSIRTWIRVEEVAFISIYLVIILLTVLSLYSKDFVVNCPVLQMEHFEELKDEIIK